jgi:glycosyltransferase involved in cell wall biosynthesis
MTKPLVTIITPCYNGEEFLNRYFDSILAQTYNRLELIFVNDGSTDRTEEIVQSYHQALDERGIIFKYLYQPNGGQAKAMNTGFKAMTGKYLVWPDSDDWLTPDAIENRVNFLETYPEFDFVRSSGDTFDFESGEYRGTINYYGDASGEDIFLDLIQENTYCACGCYMIKTAMLRDIYPDLTIYETNVGQNWQILIPIAGRGKCGYIDEAQYHIAIRRDSHSRSKRTLEEEVARRLELKKVLLIGIEKSGRKDRDYQTIVDLKYLHILYKVYLDAAAYDQAKDCYTQLKQSNDLKPAEYRSYLQIWHPVKYKLYCTVNLLQRAYRKLKRTIIK